MKPRHLSEERLALILRYARALDRPANERWDAAVAVAKWQAAVNRAGSKWVRRT